MAYITGHCTTGAQVENGEITSTTPASTYHANCPGETITKYRNSVCACTCHEGAERNPTLIDTKCPICHSRLVLHDCEEVKYQRSQHPAWQSYTTLKAEAAERRRQQTTDTDSTTTPNARTAKPTSGRCEYSGAPTRGGRFAPGNDAKLKGALLKYARTADTHQRLNAIAATAELVYRGWPYQGKGIDPEIIENAEKLADDDWYIDRMQARFAAFDAGTPHAAAIFGPNQTTKGN